MRGILVTLLGAAVLWLAMKAFWPSETAAAPPRSAGGFVAPPADPALAAAVGTGDQAQGEAPDPTRYRAPEELLEEVEPPASGRGSEARAPGSPFPVRLDRGDRSELGRILAHERHYRPLMEYLNEGEGRQMPEEVRKLASAFWFAVTGEPAEADAMARELAGAPGVSEEQLQLLESAIAAQPPAARASGRRVDPLSLGMYMGLLDRRAEAAARRGRHPEAAEAYSELLLLGLNAPWGTQTEVLSHWAAQLNAAQRNHRLDPAGDWPSFRYEVVSGDSLHSIRKKLVAERPDLRLCVGMLEILNGIEGHLHPGQVLRVPTDPASVLVDLDARLTLLLHGREVVHAWTVGIGREGQDTPVGTYDVGLKQENPSHMPIGGPQLPFGHPDNPLGTRWIAWHRNGEGTSYGFHGTNDPAGVGGRVSKGCIRMLDEDVELLFELLPVGSPIVVQP